MSVRAYAITKMEHKKSPTFNLWRNPKVVELALNNAQNENGEGGYLTFDKDEVKEIILTLNSLKKIDKETETQITIFKKILKDIPKGDTEIEYLCF